MNKKITLVEGVPFDKKIIEVEFPVDKMGSEDIESINIILKAYKKYANGEDIEFSGFNDVSRYVYIYLSNGVTICSNYGEKVEFLVTHFEDGEEFFFDTYKEAMSKYLQINI